MSFVSVALQYSGITIVYIKPEMFHFAAAMFYFAVFCHVVYAGLAYSWTNFLVLPFTCPWRCPTRKLLLLWPQLKYIFRFLTALYFFIRFFVIKITAMSERRFDRSAVIFNLGWRIKCRHEYMVKITTICRWNNRRDG